MTGTQEVEAKRDVLGELLATLDGKAVGLRRKQKLASEGLLASLPGIANQHGRHASRYEEQAAAIRELLPDRDRLNWLETMAVNVRKPLRWGSADLFWASPPDELIAEPSPLRKKIDAAMNHP